MKNITNTENKENKGPNDTPNTSNATASSSQNVKAPSTSQRPSNHIHSMTRRNQPLGNLSNVLGAANQLACADTTVTTANNGQAQKAPAKKTKKPRGKAKNQASGMKNQGNEGSTDASSSTASSSLIIPPPSIQQLGDLASIDLNEVPVFFWKYVLNLLRGANSNLTADTTPAAPTTSAVTTANNVQAPEAPANQPNEQQMDAKRTPADDEKTEAPTVSEKRTRTEAPVEPEQSDVQKPKILDLDGCFNTPEERKALMYRMMGLKPLNFKVLNIFYETLVKNVNLEALYMVDMIAENLRQPGNELDEKKLKEHDTNIKNGEKMVQFVIQKLLESVNKGELPNMNIPNPITPNTNCPNVNSLDPNILNINLLNMSSLELNVPNLITPNMNLLDMFTPNMNLPDLSTSNINLPNMDSLKPDVPNLITPNTNLPDMFTLDLHMLNMNTPIMAMPDLSVLNTNMANMNLANANFENSRGRREVAESEQSEHVPTERELADNAEYEHRANANHPIP